MLHQNPFYEKQELSQERILKILVAEKSRGRDFKTDSLPQNITTSDRVAAAIMYILANENIFKPYLVELDDKLRQALPQCHLLPTPDKYIDILEYNFPTMPAGLSMSGERLTRTLDQILLAQEHKHGVNLDRTVKDIPRFFGLVDPAHANAMVAAGSLWNDDAPFNDFWLHGERSHRKQHYIVTRYLDDHPDFFKPILSNVSTNNIFRFLVKPIATHVFYNGMGRTRGHWHCSLDDGRGDDAVINGEPTFTGPINVVEYVLEKSFFAMHPYLANEQFHSFCKPVFESAPAVDLSVPALFDELCTNLNGRVRGRSTIMSQLNNLRQKNFEKHPDFTSANVGDSFGGIIHLKPLALSRSALKSGFFCHPQKTELNERDEVKKSDQEADDLKTAPRYP